MKNPQMSYMTQQYKQQQFRQPQRQPFLNRTIIPSKDIDPVLISTLLLKVSTDEINILELGNFILSNGITTNDMLNEDGQSILHLIISNENISSRKKLEIIKYLRANFTLLMSYDKNGRTPLHLAVQNQLYDIIKELIESGHDVNAVDNFYKSSLHYAVLGKTTETPQKKEKTIIPDKKIKIKSHLLKDLTDKLVKYMEIDDNIKMFFNNQYATIYNSQILFNNEISNILNSSDIVNKIINILTNPQLTPETKQKQIFEKTEECNKNVKALITTKLQNVKKELNIQSNIENGWGPTNLNVNKILEYKTYTEFNSKLDSKLIDKINKISSHCIEINNETLGQYNNIKTNILEIQNITNLLLFMEVFYKQLRYVQIPVIGGTYYNFDNLLINNTIIDELTYDPTIRPTICDTYIYDPRLNFDIKYNLITNQIESGTNLYTGINYVNTPLNIPDTSIINNSNNSIIYDAKLAQFLNDVDNIFTGGNMVIGGINNPTLQIDQIIQTPPINPIYYITKKIYILNNLIYKEEIDEINNHILQIINLLQTNPQNMNIINYLSELNIHIYNLSNIIPKIFIEYEKIRDIMVRIKKDLYNDKEIVDEVPPPGGNRHEISILHKMCIGLIDKQLKDIDNKLSEFNIKMFGTIKKYHGIFNKFIEYINLYHSIEYTKLYYNRFNDANLFTDKTDRLNNLFYLPLYENDKFFKSYDELINFIKNNNDEIIEKNNKNKLINKYLLQFNNKNISVYINNTNPTAKTDGKNGIIIGNRTQINNLDIQLGNININYDDDYDNIYNNITYKKSDSANKQGNIEIIRLNPPSFDFLKKKLAFPIIVPLIDDFYNIQKYIITRYILDIIYDFILSPTPNIPPVINSIINELKIPIIELKTEIENSINNNPDDISTLLITIAKIIDKIYNVNLDNIINITTNDFGYRYYRNTIEKISADELAEYRIINITEINKLNIDENYFDDIKKSIYKLFRKDRKLQLYNYIENEYTKDLKDKNIFKVSTNIIGDNPNELYYKYNNEIIELLLKNGADLNIKDKDGNTPIMIAMIQNNNNLIEYMINNQKYKNISVFNKKSKNRLGIRPFDICTKSLQVIIDNYYLQLNEETLKNITKEMNDKISKLTKIKHNMRFNNILLKMTLYLVNHNFYSLLNNYKYQEDATFHNIFFNDITNEIKQLPLLGLISQIKISYHKPIDTLLEEEIKANNNDLNTLNTLKTQRRLLNDELTTLNTVPILNRNTYRIAEINDQINNLDDEITKLEPQPDYITNKTTSITRQKTRNDNLNQVDINNLLTGINVPISKDILKMYDNIIINIQNQNKDDYRTYMSLWEKLFETDINNDSTQIINKTLNKLNILVKSCKDSKDIQNFDINNINAIEHGIKICTNYVNDYFDLPFVYDGDNYALNQIINIFIHIIKNTLFVNLYHIIEKLIRVEITNKIQRVSGQTQIDYERELDETVTKIIESTVNNINIKIYLFDTLPEKIIKILLNLYENDDDDDKKTNIITLFEFINRILETNTIMQINKDTSKIIPTLNEHVYPYFKEYLDSTVTNMKKTIDGYLSNILNLYSKLNLFKNIVNKAYTEKY